MIEFVDAIGFATGLIVAVQVKSGASYPGDKEERIIYRPARKHVNKLARVCLYKRPWGFIADVATLIANACARNS